MELPLSDSFPNIEFRLAGFSDIIHVFSEKIKRRKFYVGFSDREGDFDPFLELRFRAVRGSTYRYNFYAQRTGTSRALKGDIL